MGPAVGGVHEVEAEAVGGVFKSPRIHSLSRVGLMTATAMTRIGRSTVSLSTARKLLTMASSADPGGVSFMVWATHGNPMPLP